MQDVAGEVAGGITGRNNEGVEHGGNETEGVEETVAQGPTMTLSFRSRSS